ncbi:hypothetical protein H9P43_003646 [Blastocladiella emersonii ATCC 22665]|nr:hypothetical protein H9P43_003646 [Blastocladiella emersonii ATCC 22665]
MAEQYSAAIKVFKDDLRLRNVSFVYTSNDTLATGVFPGIEPAASAAAGDAESATLSPSANFPNLCLIDPTTPGSGQLDGFGCDLGERPRTSNRMPPMTLESARTECGKRHCADTRGKSPSVELDCMLRHCSLLTATALSDVCVPVDHPALAARGVYPKLHLEAPPNLDELSNNGDITPLGLAVYRGYLESAKLPVPASLANVTVRPADKKLRVGICMPSLPIGAPCDATAYDSGKLAVADGWVIDADERWVTAGKLAWSAKNPDLDVTRRLDVGEPLNAFRKSDEAAQHPFPVLSYRTMAKLEVLGGKKGGDLNGHATLGRCVASGGGKTGTFQAGKFSGDSCSSNAECVLSANCGPDKTCLAEVHASAVPMVAKDMMFTPITPDHLAAPYLGAFGTYRWWWSPMFATLFLILVGTVYSVRAERRRKAEVEAAKVQPQSKPTAPALEV